MLLNRHFFLFKIVPWCNFHIMILDVRKQQKKRIHSLWPKKKIKISIFSKFYLKLITGRSVYHKTNPYKLFLKYPYKDKIWRNFCRKTKEWKWESVESTYFWMLQAVLKINMSGTVNEFCTMLYQILCLYMDNCRYAIWTITILNYLSIIIHGSGVLISFNYLWVLVIKNNNFWRDWI